MKKLLFYIMVILLPATSMGQSTFWEPAHYDSTIVNFIQADSISSRIIPDSATIPLWQKGNSHKSGFALDTGGAQGMMTDTLAFYPVNANNWFQLKLPNYPNPIVEISHRYKTDSAQDGGIIEYSNDTGLTWKNVANCDNLIRSGLYNVNDSLPGGTAAFSGSSNGTVHTRIQFMNCWALKSTASCSFHGLFGPDQLRIRFRFISDAAADTLSGWLIDSIKIINPRCVPGAVNDVSNKASLNITPNPSYDGTFYFPLLEDEQGLTIEVYNPLGQQILRQTYRHTLDLTRYPTGIYYYKVSNKELYYSGRLLKE